MQPLFIDFSVIHFCLLSYDVKYVITLFLKQPKYVFLHHVPASGHNEQHICQ